jgi:hypothetical protein
MGMNTCFLGRFASVCERESPLSHPWSVGFLPLDPALLLACTQDSVRVAAMALHLFPRHLLGFRFPRRKERRRLEGIVRDWRAGDGAAFLLTAFSSRFDLRIKEPR